MQHLIFLSFQYRKYSNCYIIALQYFLKYGSAIIQQLLHLIFLFLQVEHIAIAILLYCNILIILQCNNIAIAIFSLSSFKLQFYRIKASRPDSIAKIDDKIARETMKIKSVNLENEIQKLKSQNRVKSVFKVMEAVNGTKKQQPLGGPTAICDMRINRSPNNTWLSNALSSSLFICLQAVVL